MAGAAFDSRYQHTIERDAFFVGAGGLTGRAATLRVLPAAVGHGVRFQRRDVSDAQATCLAGIDHARSFSGSLSLTNEAGIRVGGVGDLLAALYGCGVDNAMVQVDGPEVPSLDGTSKAFARVFNANGVRCQEATRKILRVDKPVGLHRGDSFVVLSPQAGVRLSVTLDCPFGSFEREHLSLDITGLRFLQELAHARKASHVVGDAPASPRPPLSPKFSGVLVPDEPLGDWGIQERVRREAVDLLAEVSLAGGRLQGHVHAYRPTVEVVLALLRKLLSATETWSYADQRFGVP